MEDYGRSHGIKRLLSDSEEDCLYSRVGSSRPQLQRYRTRTSLNIPSSSDDSDQEEMPPVPSKRIIRTVPVSAKKRKIDNPAGDEKQEDDFQGKALQDTQLEHLLKCFYRLNMQSESEESDDYDTDDEMVPTRRQKRKDWRKYEVVNDDTRK